ncbi:MAG: tetratricopeptide repeat protein [Deltaproteobacteria bacterium]|nr:tetratricopeptide repeat protein [Deltaproteobacteria bacterium]
MGGREWFFPRLRIGTGPGLMKFMLVGLICFLSLGLFPGVSWGSEPGEIFLARGTKFYLDRKYAEAKDQFAQGVKTDPENAELWVALGTATLALKDYPAAKEAFSKGVTLDPEVPRGKMYLGVTYYFLSNFREAERLLQEAKAQNPNDAMVHYYLGLVASRDQKSQYALQELEIGMSLEPGYGPGFKSAIQAAQEPDKGKRPYGISFATGVEYDDNVKVLPDNISAAGLQNFYGPYKGHKADMRTPLILRAFWEPLQTPNSALGVRYYNYAGLNYYLDNFNVVEQFGELYYKYQLNRVSITPYYIFDYTWVGGQPWSMFNNVGMRLTLQETSNLTGDLVYMFKAQDYKWLRSGNLPSQINRSGYVNQIGMFQTFNGSKGAVRAGFYWEREVTDGINWTQNVYHFPIDAYLSLPWQISAYGFFEYAYGAYSNQDYTYQKRRRDNLFTVICQLRRPITSWASVIAMYTHSNNDGCNISDYRYHRNIYSLLLNVYY